MLPKLNSAHGSETRNIINRAIEVLNEQGKTIQDLVAEGQLTPAQYGQLISIVNGNVKKGSITAADIDKNNFQLDQTHLSDELKQQITGDAPINATPADGSLTTKKYADKSVTFDKVDFAREVAKLAENIIVNGNFAEDSDGDGTADGWSKIDESTMSPRVEDNTQYWTPTDTFYSSSTGYISDSDEIEGNKYYISFEQKNISYAHFIDSSQIFVRNIETDGKISLIYTPNSSGKGFLRFYPRAANVETSLKNVMVVDLTKTFGAGNEPSLGYFEYLLDLLGFKDWFGGSLNLTNATKNGVVTARDLKVYDPDEEISADNVNDALMDLYDGIVKATPGKNLYNPDNNVEGTLSSSVIGSVQTIVENSGGIKHYSQKIKLSGKNSVTLSNVRVCAITTLEDVALKGRNFIGGQTTTTFSPSELPDSDYYLWVSVRDDVMNATQIELGSSSTSYEPYKPVGAVYANGVKLFDYPLEVTGGGDKKKEIYDLAKAALENEALNEEINFLSNNAEVSNKSDATNPTDTQVINLTDSTNAQKLILHLHKREKESGFGSINDAYLPNAKDDFSDVKITGDTGEVLSYRITHRTDDFDIVPYDWTRESKMASATFMDSLGNLYQSDEFIRMSEDKGMTWVNLPQLKEFTRAQFDLIAQDDTMYFSHGSGLYRSEAPYTNYQRVLELNPTQEYDVVSVTGKSLVQHPDGELFCGLYQTPWNINIYKSIDNGLTWELSADWTDEYQHVHGMFVDEFTGAVYAGLDGGGGVLKSTDKGVTWTDLRAENPDMPQATDYGVRYADPSGYRLLGGETPIVGGHSIIKTFDDQNFYPVLSDGISVNYVIKLGNRMFATGSGSNAFRNGAIYVSRDNAETWESVFRTGPLLDLWSANDGYRYMEQISENEIFVGPQSYSRPPLRIFGSGHYAELVVDVPSGTNSITVESGHSYPNELPITNDTETAGEVLVHFPLNENGRVVEESVSRELFENDFEWIEGGRRFSYFYPYINPSRDKHSVKMSSLSGFDVVPNDFNISSGVTMSFWAKLSLGTRFVLIETDNGDRLEIVNGYQLHLNGNNAMSFNFPTVPGPFIKHDLLFHDDGTISLYTNGIERNHINDRSDGVLSALSKSDGMEFLRNVSSNSDDAIQHFMLRRGIIDGDQLLDEFNSGITDNIE